MTAWTDEKLGLLKSEAKSTAGGADTTMTTEVVAFEDKVKVGVFPTASSLPYFVAIERGFFKEQNIEPETIRLIGGPPNIAAMISNQIEAAIVLVTIEAMNAKLATDNYRFASLIESIITSRQFLNKRGPAASAVAVARGAGKPC